MRKRRTPEQRRRDRAAGIDRYGRALPRSEGTNPRACGAAPAEGESAAIKWRIPRHLIDDFVTQERIACFRCANPRGPWAAAGHSGEHGPWVICKRCVIVRSEQKRNKRGTGSA